MSSETKKGRILAVDDEPQNRELIEALLVDAGFDVELAADGDEALEKAAADPPDVIVLDVMMPRLDGFETATRLRQDRQTCFVPIVMVTALTDLANRVRGLEAGADDFLSKPVNSAELLARTRALLRIRRLREELDSAENVIYAMIGALESKNPRTIGHSNRVAALATFLARRLRLPTSEIDAIVRGATLHDIGKIAIPDEILEAEGSLSASQSEVLASHPAAGERILAPLDSFRAVRNIVLHHHERLDGSGFPDGLAGLSFSLPIEIVAAANFFDDLIHSERLSFEAAAERLRGEGRRGRFHSDLLEELLLAARSLEREALPPLELLLPPPTWVGTGKILLVDPSSASRGPVVGVLAEEGYEVRTLGDAASALDALSEVRPDLILIAAQTSSIDPYELARHMRDREPAAYLPIAVLGSTPGGTNRIAALEGGADDFLASGFDRTELVARVRSLMRLRLYGRDLEQRRAVILSLAAALEAKDPYTKGHSHRVADLAVRLGSELGLGKDECERLRIGGLLHDVGKLGVPERILHRPEPLSEEEFARVKTHPRQAADICSSLLSVKSIIPYIHHHHERWDGSGYPDGLAGNDIPLGARILGLVDAYEALTSVRPFRRRLSGDEALEVLEKEAASGRWDPQLAKAFTSMIRRSSQI